MMSQLNSTKWSDKKKATSMKTPTYRTTGLKTEYKPPTLNRDTKRPKKKQIDIVSSAILQEQNRTKYGEEVDKSDVIPPEGGVRGSLRRIKDYISNLPTFEPNFVKISTVSEEYIEKMSVIEINNPSLDPTTNQGVSSSKMGTTDGNICCNTCLSVFCNGHFGKIRLVVPVINKVFFREIVAVMNCICPDCSVPLKSPDDIREQYPEFGKLQGWPRLQLYASACKPAKGSTCVRDDCLIERNIGGKKIADNQLNVIPINTKESRDHNYFKRGKKYISSTEIYRALDNISDQNAVALGFNKDMHPRDMIIRVLPVLPPIARPPVHANGREKQDQLTDYYISIINANNTLRDNMHKKESDIEASNTLYECVTQLINGGKKKRVDYGDSIGIMQRINGKKGIFRKTMQGKRVNQSGRAVLGPDINIEFGEIGIPEVMARIFTLPVTVTQLNFASIEALIQSGKVVSITKKTGDLAGIKIPVHKDDEISLEIGDIIERMCIDGDMCVFNRQPTIHHGSLLGYTVKVMKEGHTIRIHPSSTTSHNADFDGDAAMVLFPQDPAAIEEVRQLIHTVRNIIDDKQNRPMAGVIMDAITSAYLMTGSTEIIHPLIFLSAISEMKIKIDIKDLQERASRYGIHPWSGMTLFSAVLPRDLTYNNAGVIIHEGILFSGRVTAGAIDTSPRSLIQEIWKFYGYQRAADFITDSTRVLLSYINSYGFSIGPEDVDFGQDDDIKELKQTFLTDINSQIRDLGPIPTTQYEKEKREAQVISIIDRVKVFGSEIATKTMKEGVREVYGRQNAIGIMAKDIGAGAKAAIENVSMMGGSIGQQYYAGERPTPSLLGGGSFFPRKFSTVGWDERLPEGMTMEEATSHLPEKVDTKGWARFLPTTPLRPLSTEAPVEERGYCPASFADGMTPTESFAQAWGTRGDLINTNLMTATVGDAQRRLTKALENITIAKDGSVRSLTKYIYQFSWGNDGLESMYMVQTNTPHYGRVPTFCDIEDIVERVNSQFGFIRVKYLDIIKSNKDKIKIEKMETNFEMEQKRFVTPMEQGKIYYAPADSIAYPFPLDPVNSKENSKIKYGIPEVINTFTIERPIEVKPFITVDDRPERKETIIQRNTRIVRPTEAFEKQRGEKESFTSQGYHEPGDPNDLDSFYKASDKSKWKRVGVYWYNAEELEARKKEEAKAKTEALKKEAEAEAKAEAEAEAEAEAKARKKEEAAKKKTTKSKK